MTELDPNNLPDGVHYWPIDKEESSRLSSLLEYDFGSLDIAGHFVMRPQLSCSECGKFSGLDDFVHTSLRQEIHSKRFMINILKHHPISDGREHYLHCSSCDTLFVEQTTEATFTAKAAFAWPGHGYLWSLRNSPKVAAFPWPPGPLWILRDSPEVVVQ